MLYVEKLNPSQDLLQEQSKILNSNEWNNILPDDSKKMRDYFDGKLSNTELRKTASKFKKQAREELYLNQKGLCAYCMIKITLNEDEANEKLLTTKIEHYKPISYSANPNCKNDTFDIYNYLLVCNGGTAGITLGNNGNACCDSKRENKPITINPHLQQHIDYINYHEDGIVYINSLSCTDKNLYRELENDINEKLGLNGTLYIKKTKNNTYDTRTKLVEGRKSAYASAVEAINCLVDSGDISLESIKILIDAEINDPHAFSGVYLSLYRSYI